MVVDRLLRQAESSMSFNGDRIANTHTTREKVAHKAERTVDWTEEPPRVDV